MSTQISQQNLKELYDKDFYLWIQKNIELLKSKNFDAVDWINLIEELEDMGRKPENIPLAKKIFGKIPSQNDFPKNCPYSYQQILDYKPWIKELDK